MKNLSQPLKNSLFPALFGLSLLSMPMLAHGADLSAESRTDLKLTIFEQNLALVDDSRKADLEKGGNSLSVLDVSRNMMPETALLNGDGLVVTSQVFDANTITLNRLVQMHLGQKVKLRRVNQKTGDESIVAAEIISVDGGLLVKTDRGIESVDASALVFETLPDGLRAKPSLIAEVESAKAVKGLPVTLRYMTGGLSWSTDYVADLSDGGDLMGLTGWATIRNQGETAFPMAKIGLLSGDINRRSTAPQAKTMMRAEMTMMADAAPADGVSENAINGYHLYTLEQAVDIGANMTRQVALVTAPKVLITTDHVIAGQIYYLHGRQSAPTMGKATRQVRFINDSASGLGLPLPAGLVRFYKGGSFVGEDRLERTGKGEEKTLTLGRDFDISFKRTQTDYKRLTNNVIETSHEITVTNGSDKAVAVRIEDPMANDWEILSQSHKHTKANAHRADWVLDIASGKSETLTYRVRTRF